MSIYIDCDEIKKNIPGYKADQASQYHRLSVKIANLEYQKAIKTSRFQHVILLSGGSASGKTEFIEAYLKTKKAIIFDSTLSSTEAFLIKNKLAAKYNKKVAVYAIWPRSLEDAFLAFLKRERKFELEHFLRTHEYSRNVLLYIAKFHSTTIKIYVNTYDYNVKLKYNELLFEDRSDLITYLQNNQITKADILNKII